MPNNIKRIEYNDLEFRERERACKDVGNIWITKREKRGFVESCMKGKQSPLFQPY